jgi:hypothetical protein
MECLKEILLVFEDQPLDIAKSMSGDAAVSSQSDWTQPELAFTA